MQLEIAKVTLENTVRNNLNLGDHVKFANILFVIFDLDCHINSGFEADQTSKIQ